MVSVRNIDTGYQSELTKYRKGLTDMPEVPKMIGEYRVLQVLGSGGMGVVYLARHVKSERTVALKTLHVNRAGNASGIRREIRALARIQHPGVVKIIDEGIMNDIPWYAMDLIKGVTLRRYSGEFIWPEGDSSPTWGSQDMEPMEWEPGSPQEVTARWWTQIFGVTVGAEGFQLPDRIPEPVAQPAAVSRVRAAGGAVKSVLNIMNSLCRTLAFLHGEGIVHGDLKPENIIVRPDGMPVILDFGLMTQIWPLASREDLENLRATGGTAVYIAPEQIMGELIDPRADLYSVGCILFELLTGTIPFSGKSHQEIIMAHLGQTPVAPSIYASEIPTELERLILKLLKKRPQDRPGHAGEVLQVLEKLGSVSPASITFPKPKPYLYRPRFAGRKDLLNELESHLNNATQGNGNIVFINGESGIGKTRLMLKMAHLARHRKCLVFAGECGTLAGSSHSSSENQALSVLKRPFQCIAEYCLEKGVAECQRVFGSNAALLAGYEPVLGRLPGVSQSQRLPDLPLNAARLRILTAIVDMLTSLAQDKPVFLMLDDLHWADDLSLDFLEFAVRLGRLKHTKLLIVGTYRPEEASELLNRITNLQAIPNYSLARLSRDAVKSVVSDMLAISDPLPVFVDFLERFSEGNPFFITEYLHAALIEGFLYRNESGSWHVFDQGSDKVTAEMLFEKPLPHTLMDLIKRRLSMLSPGATRVLDAISVIGQELDILLIWHLIPFTDHMLDAVDELIRRQIIREISPGKLAFVHGTIQQVAYQRLSEAVLPDLHRAAADAIERLYGSSNPAFYHELARHRHRAGELDDARSYYLASAHHAISQTALSEAEKWYRNYLSIIPAQTEESVDVHLEFIRNVLSVQSRYTEALEEFSAALNHASSVNNSALIARSLLGLADTHRVLGNTREAEKYCLKLLDCVHEPGNQYLRGAALNSLGSLRTNQGRFDEARSLYTEAMQCYASEKKMKSQANSMVNLAEVLRIQGEFQDARDLYQGALDIFRQTNDRLSIAWCLGNFANVHYFMGDTGKAQTLFSESLEIAQEVGDRQAESIYLSNLANIAGGNKELNRAVTLYCRALQIQREIGDRRMEGLTLSNLACIYRDKGCPQEGLKMFQEALDIQTELGNRQHQAEILANTAELKRLMDADYIVAGELIRRAKTIFEQTRDSVGIGLCLIELGHLALANHQSAEYCLQDLKALSTGLSGQNKSILEHGFNQLQNAQIDFQNGRSLFRGGRLEDIPPKLRTVLMNQNGDCSSPTES